MIQICKARHVELEDFGQQIANACTTNTTAIGSSMDIETPMPGSNPIPATEISESDNSQQPEDDEDYNMDIS